MKLRILPALFAVLFAPGCVMVQIGVTNPIPGLTTVAVAPFLNLSAEKAADGRRFALAYASELQKVPGFEVLPVGVTEVAMVDGKIDLNDVDEVLKLAKILRVDAVVVGALTRIFALLPAADRHDGELVFAAGLVVLSGNPDGTRHPGPTERLGQGPPPAVARLSKTTRRAMRS